MKTRQRLPELDLHDQLRSQDPEIASRARAVLAGKKPCVDCHYNPCIGCSGCRFRTTAYDVCVMLYCAKYASMPLAKRRQWCPSFEADPDADIRACATFCCDWMGYYRT